MKNLLISGSLATIATLLTGAAGIIQTSIVVFYLGKNDYEFWFMLMGALPFIGLLDLGTSAVMPRMTALAQGAGASTTELSILIQALLLPPAIISLLFLVGFLIFEPTISESLGIGDNSRIALFLFSFASIIRLAQLILATVFVGIQKTPTERALKLAYVVMTVSGAYVAGKFNFGIVGIITAQLFAAIINLFITIYLLRNLMHPFHSLDELWQIWRKHSSKLADSFFTTAPALAILNVGLWFVIDVLGQNAVSEYSTIYQIGSAVLLITQIPTILICPHISRFHISRQNSNAASAIIINTRMVTMIATALTGLIIMNFSNIEAVWLHNKVEISRSFGILYGCAIAIEAIQISLTQPCYFAGYHRFAAITWASGILLCLLLPTALQTFGITGAALSMLVAQMMTCHYYNTKIALKLFKLRFLSDLLKDAFAIGIARATLPITSAFLIIHLFEPNHFHSLFISTLIVTIVVIFIAQKDFAALAKII